MIRRSFGTLVFVALVVASGGTQPRAPLTGTWEGQLLLNSNWRFMEADFGATGKLADARVDLPQERREFTEFSTDGQSVRWTLLRGQGRIRFEGTREDDIIRGSAEQNGVAGEFQLIRIAASKQRETAPYAATYRSDTGDLITVARFDFGDGVDRLALRRGYWGTLMPTGRSEFLFAPARSGRFPVALRIAFGNDSGGRAMQVTLEGPDRERVAARRADLYDTSDVTFANGAVRLAGTAIRSHALGRRPAVVMVHSSGNQSRNGPNAYFRLIANVLATNGITTLVYDKRGVGDSTGSWPTATFDDLAGDLHAAIDAVRRVPGVDPTGIGIWSLSQGGWIAPLVAAMDEKLRFLVLVSAAATSPAQQEIARVSAVMRAAGSPSADVAAASNYLQMYFDVVAGTRPWSELQAEMTSTASQPELDALRSTVAPSQQPPGGLSTCRSLSPRPHHRSGPRVPAPQSRLPAVTGRLDPRPLGRDGALKREGRWSTRPLGQVRTCRSVRDAEGDTSRTVAWIDGADGAVYLPGTIRLTLQNAH